MAQNEEILVLCKDCEYAKMKVVGEKKHDSYIEGKPQKISFIYDYTGECDCADSLITDFVLGRKECKIINSTGKCRHFIKSERKRNMASDNYGFLRRKGMNDGLYCQS